MEKISGYVELKRLEQFQAKKCHRFTVYREGGKMSKKKKKFKGSMLELIKKHLGVCEDCGGGLELHGFSDKGKFVLGAKCKKCGKIQ